mgnify:FL=1
MRSGLKAGMNTLGKGVNRMRTRVSRREDEIARLYELKSGNIFVWGWAGLAV